MDIPMPGREMIGRDASSPVRFAKRARRKGLDGCGAWKDLRRLHDVLLGARDCGAEEARRASLRELQRRGRLHDLQRPAAGLPRLRMRMADAARPFPPIETGPRRHDSDGRCRQRRISRRLRAGKADGLAPPAGFLPSRGSGEVGANGRRQSGPHIMAYFRERRMGSYRLTFAHPCGILHEISAERVGIFRPCRTPGPPMACVAIRW